MMNRLAIRFKMALVLLISLVTYQSMPTYLGVAKVSAADCSTPGAAAMLGIYTTDRADFKRPDTTLDPQTFLVGQQSVRMEVEIEDVNGCPVPAPDSTQIALTVTDTDADLLSAGGVNQSQAYNFTIATGNSRQGFYVKGRKAVTASLTAATRDSSLVTLTSGTQNVIIAAPSPVLSKITFNDNAHGAADSISGTAGAVAASTQVPGGITVRVYAQLTDTVPLDSVMANTDGSFNALETGDDTYRQVYVRAEYPGSVLSSSATVVQQAYPSLVTGLKALHGTTDGAQISWTSTESGASYRIYRKLASDAAFSESSFIVASTSTSYLDNTALIGVDYQYSVKQVNVAGSYTPEFSPVTSFRFDIANVQLSSATPNAPQVSFDTSSDLADHANLIKVTFSNTASGTTYTGTLTQTATHFVSKSLYYDNASNALTVLPDGTYIVTVSAIDATLGFNDTVTVSNNFSIDTVAPTSPVLSSLRFTDGVMSGLVGAVEANAFVDIYATDPLTSTDAPQESVRAQSDGSFVSSVLTVPPHGIFYLIARDEVGNESGVTAFDVVSKPAIPRIDLITMHQNNPGTNDHIIGTAGAATGGLIVKFFAADPALNPNLVPVRETVALPDGSFDQEVGDNLSTVFWVVVWSGNGLQSDAIMLTNTTAIGTPTYFSVSQGDSTAILRWAAVSGTSFYSITVYDVTTRQNVQYGTVPATQTELLVSNLINGHLYRFYVNAIDAYGNVGQAVEREVSPHAKVVTQATSSTASTSAEAPRRSVSQSTKQVPETTPEITPPAAPEAPTSTPTTRDWTTWIIIGLGLLLLALAAFFGWQLWFKDSSETIVTTVKKTQDKTQTKESASDKKPDNTNKPRW